MGQPDTIKWSQYPGIDPEWDHGWDYLDGDKVISRRSVDVMCSDGVGVWFGYLEVDDEFGPRWYQCGRDMYSLDGITHFAPKPGPPLAKALAGLGGS